MIPDYESILHVRRRRRWDHRAAGVLLMKIFTVISLLLLVAFVARETAREQRIAEQVKRREVQTEAELRYGLRDR